ncbi:MAG: diaminopimelate epimerase, partial [Beijerinckiaceae bacterium]
DLRGTGLHVSASEAAAIARDPRSRFDQLMVLHDPVTAGTAAFVRIYNTDGSEAGACGNGTRCVAWALAEDTAMRLPPGSDTDALTLQTRPGLLRTWRKGPLDFTVDMGAPGLRWQDIPTRDPFHDTTGIELQIGPIDAPILHTPSVVSMGNPHAIFWVKDVAAYDLAKIGSLLEYHPQFPDRANITLAQVMARDHVIIRVWERGAGLTRACGTAACATLVAAVRKNYCDRAARITLPGGDLFIEWRADTNRVLMTGPVELEWEGVFDAALFAADQASA